MAPAGRSLSSLASNVPATTSHARTTRFALPSRAAARSMCGSGCALVELVWPGRREFLHRIAEERSAESLRRASLALLRSSSPMSPTKFVRVGHRCRRAQLEERWKLRSKSRHKRFATRARGASCPRAVAGEVAPRMMVAAPLRIAMALLSAALGGVAISPVTEELTVQAIDGHTTYR